MVKRYYCDYCDRSFKDDPEARKKHLTSLLHVNAQKDHYRLFKEPEETLKEELAKITCKRFSLNGECPFGYSCRFSHYTPNMIGELRQIVAMKKQAEENPRNNWPDPNAIAEEYLKTTTNDDNEMKSIKEPWKVPVELQHFPTLPPSLWPLNSHTINDPPVTQWG
ncbi:zinc finger matrin-type protein 5-like [Leptopilina heterotoma]|uniref:zinc finger matrin-type protein 5-like n=1 Tax=Leptopilina heterotoma TaxID=63436 RepID=UPI001CA8DF6E|nr:zinc finger matrin-type protein 5-like [Leptopilina heterotoma]